MSFPHKTAFIFKNISVENWLLFMENCPHVEFLHVSIHIDQSTKIDEKKFVTILSRLENIQELLLEVSSDHFDDKVNIEEENPITILELMSRGIKESKSLMCFTYSTTFFPEYFFTFSTKVKSTDYFSSAFEFKWKSFGFRHHFYQREYTDLRIVNIVRKSRDLYVTKQVASLGHLFENENDDMFQSFYQRIYHQLLLKNKL